MQIHQCLHRTCADVGNAAYWECLSLVLFTQEKGSGEAEQAQTGSNVHPQPGTSWHPHTHTQSVCQHKEHCNGPKKYNCVTLNNDLIWILFTHISKPILNFAFFGYLKTLQDVRLNTMKACCDQRLSKSIYILKSSIKRIHRTCTVHSKSSEGIK